MEKNEIVSHKFAFLDTQISLIPNVYRKATDTKTIAMTSTNHLSDDVPPALDGDEEGGVFTAVEHCNSG